MLKIKNLHKNYGSTNLFSDVTVSLGKGQKAALVGHNGAGKTTLLKIIAGIDKQDSGELTIERSACIGYLPQDTSLVGNESIIDCLKKISGIDVLEQELERLSSEQKTPVNSVRYGELHGIYEHLEGYSFLHKVKSMMAGFGLDYLTPDHKLSNLSSGQKSKVALIGILLKGVDLLLLDEPTNNLDLPALIWLENFLQRSNATCIIVSHDRRFLDRVANKILEIDRNTHSLNVNNGSYSNYLDLLAKRSANLKEQYLHQQEEIERLSSRAREIKNISLKGSRWSGSDNDKFLKGFKRDQAAKSSKTAKSIEKRIDKMERVEKPIERKPFEIPLVAKKSFGSMSLRVTNLVAGYPDNFTIGPLSLEINYGERICIMGFNGSGKSTLLKTISGTIQALDGHIELGTGIVIGNMMQEHDNLPKNMTLLEFMSDTTNISRQESYSVLAKFGFTKNQPNLQIASLSPGGRARLLLALFSVKSVNFLVLDEPTNHLDIEALEALEETLSNYNGTVLMVSHDRYFIESVALNTMYVLSEGVLTKIPDYGIYIETAETKAKQLLRLI